jgi:hypothetical protein
MKHLYRKTVMSMSELSVSMESFVSTVSRREMLCAQLAAHLLWSESERVRREREIQQCDLLLQQEASGLKVDQIALAESVMYVKGYERGGEDRESVVQDAIKWFAKPPSNVISLYDLRTMYFGTKNYDRWRGQRCDCSYGCGPRHGSVCFEVGLLPDARKRELLPAEREACLYYLLNIVAIEEARRASAAAPTLQR